MNFLPPLCSNKIEFSWSLIRPLAAPLLSRNPSIIRLFLHGELRSYKQEPCEVTVYVYRGSQPPRLGLPAIGITRAKYITLDWSV